MGRKAITADEREKVFAFLLRETRWKPLKRYPSATKETNCLVTSGVDSYHVIHMYVTGSSAVGGGGWRSSLKNSFHVYQIYACSLACVLLVVMSSTMRWRCSM